MLRGSDNVLVASFTVAAAAELGSRGLPLPKSQLGTLHSIAYRTLDRPPVAAEMIPDWNTTHPALALSVSGRTELDDGVAPSEWTGATEGDALMSALDSCRARMLPEDLWPKSVAVFHRKWSEWKKANGVIDFTDMIELALGDVDRAPGNPQVGFFDEAQDFTPLELALIRKWGAHMERVVLAGDDDQTIYGFKGASPDAFLNPPLPDEDKHILAQSWRIPASVHRAAEHWIRQLTRREPKQYLPRDEEGVVRHAPLCYSAPGPMVDAIVKAMDVGTVMVLASCGYMLDPIKHELRRQGVPFHNPYRRSRGDWNPLRPARGTSSRDRLLAYLLPDERQLGDLSRLWTGRDVQTWAGVLRTSGVMIRGAKQMINELPPRELTFEEVAVLFANDTDLDLATEPSLEWYASNLLAAAKPGMEFPLQVVRRRGARALLEEPRVILGTTHSVKGGQADCSPPDEPVLTTNRGWVPIADLDPATDRLVSFNSDHHKIHRGGPRRPDGYAFTMGSRPYDGDLLTITTPTSRTRVTPNHHLTVRWSPRALDAHAGYLMRRGDRWRIGVSALHHARGQSGPLMRARREGADAVWLLSLHQRREDALAAEAVAAWSSGVPDMTFVADGRTLPQDVLDTIWARLGGGPAAAAKELLASRGMHEDWPMWELADPQRRQSGMRNRWTVRAANLMPGWMELPTDPGFGQQPVWQDVQVAWSRYRGMVYSLDVERWHHYVSGGAIVHNCVFVIPDLSARGLMEWEKVGEPRDGIVRQFYVAMTRAKRQLIVCSPSTTSSFVSPERLVAGARPGSA